MPLYESIAAPRFHYQWKPDKLILEPPFAPSVVDGLKALGYKIDEDADGIFCKVMAVAAEKDGFRGVSDPLDAWTSAVDEFRFPAGSEVQGPRCSLPLRVRPFLPIARLATRPAGFVTTRNSTIPLSWSARSVGLVSSSEAGRTD